MEYSTEILRYEEQVILQLRTLYRKLGYIQYTMSRFEEYELYAENKAFMPSGEILTFAGVGGKLMALRPDVTLSIVKYAKNDDKLKKLYYNENVYRSDGVEFKEQMQVGLECIGQIDIKLVSEVLMLAKRSLEALGAGTRLDISHMGFLSGLMLSEDITSVQRNEIIDCISTKNISGLKTLCTDFNLCSEFCERITKLSMLYGSYEELASELRSISINEDMDNALNELEELHSMLDKLGVKQGVNLDFSIVNDISYYSGVVFQGFIEGIPAKVLSGGRYDELLCKFGRKDGAIGFAVYLDMLEKPDLTNAEVKSKPDTEAGMINIALPKGRLGEKVYAIFEASGYGCPDIYEESRKLVFENPEKTVRYFWVKPTDVARYVERGAADIGVAGKDILLEYTPEVYELLDLGIGKCSINVAAKRGFLQKNSGKTLRVATKFPNITRAHYKKHGREIDVIELNGSIELAPLLGLSDVIVDIVETGRTLSDNDMELIEPVADISARLISNKASYKFNHKDIDKLCAKITEYLHK